MNKILLVGDSTVTEQSREPDNPAIRYCGWGQMLEQFLKPGIEVYNFAVSGYTVETFRTNGKYKELTDKLTPGDFVLLQFGHNDQKVEYLQAEGGYRKALEDYITQLRELGGRPILVTSVARNSWRGDNGEYNDLLAPYAETVLRVGSEMKVPVLDLHSASMAWIKELGVQKAKRYFYPGDYTHPNDFGGYKWAEMIAGLSVNEQEAYGEEFSDLFAHPSDWTEYPLPEADPVFGWTAPPKPRYTFEEYSGEENLTHEEALDIAMKGYGYFCANGNEEGLPGSVLGAVQNGFLPESITAKEYAQRLQTPINTKLFQEIMLTACGGRNKLSNQLSLPELGAEGTITRKKAVRYVMELEKAATGCEALNDTPDFIPAGS